MPDLSSLSFTPEINSHTWYRLQNGAQNEALDVINDGRGSREGLLKIAALGNYSGQYWQILPREDGMCALCTMYLGTNMQLDVYGDNTSKPHLAARGDGNFSGQAWRMDSWPDGTYKLSNLYGGQSLALDSSGAQVKMVHQDANSASQRWRITPIKEITELAHMEGHEQ